MTEDFKKILNSAGLKSTTPRLVVLKALSELKHPMTAQEIQRKLGKNKIDLVTLYRTLASFEEKQLVKRVSLKKDAVYYELDTDHHHHIICKNCSKVEDFENTEIEKVLEEVIRKSSKFKIIKDHALELFGVCNACIKS
jgi:Fur family ferric uptake transcriptional regulator